MCLPLLLSCTTGTQQDIVQGMCSLCAGFKEKKLDEMSLFGVICLKIMKEIPPGFISVKNLKDTHLEHWLLQNSYSKRPLILRQKSRDQLMINMKYLHMKNPNYCRCRNNATILGESLPNRSFRLSQKNDKDKQSYKQQST